MRVESDLVFKGEDNEHVIRGVSQCQAGCLIRLGLRFRSCLIEG